MDYKFDVFFSYRRNQLTQHWHDKLVEHLEYWINQELPDQNVRIFFDKNSIDVGDIWPDQIKDALKHSKCLVAIMSPDYFKSKWCYAELLSFKERQENLDAGGGLILGARFHDGHSFPQKVNNIQQVDFSKYASTSETFWETRLASEFVDVIKDFAKSIARSIVAAPNFEDTFPIIVPDENEIPTNSITRLV